MFFTDKEPCFIYNGRSFWKGLFTFLQWGRDFIWTSDEHHSLFFTHKKGTSYVTLRLPITLFIFVFQNYSRPFTILDNGKMKWSGLALSETLIHQSFHCVNPNDKNFGLIQDYKSSMRKLFSHLAKLNHNMALTQLVEWLLPRPVDPGSNMVVGNCQITFSLVQTVEKTKKDPNYLNKYKIIITHRNSKQSLSQPFMNHSSDFKSMKIDKLVSNYLCLLRLLFLKMGHSRPLFLYFRLFNPVYIRKINVLYKNPQGLVSNRRPLVS